MTTTTMSLAILGLFYALFWFWYTGRQRPLTQQEIDAVLPKLAAQEADEQVLNRIQAFLASDTGKGFVIIVALLILLVV